MASKAHGNNLKTLFRCYHSRSHGAFSFKSTEPISDAMFQSLVQAHCNSSYFSRSKASKLLNSFLKSKPIYSIYSLNLLFSSLSKMGHFAAVVSVYSRLLRVRGADFRPDVFTFTNVIKCLCRSNNVKMGFSVLGSMIKSGVGHNSVTLGSLLDGLCREGLMLEAVSLFDWIKRYDASHLNEVVYGTLISGFSRKGEATKAIEVLREMENPNAHCFGSVIDCLCKLGFVDEGLCLFQTMIRRGVETNVVINTSLIHGLCKSGRRSEAVNLFRNISPNDRTFNVLIDSLCKDEKMGEVFKLFEEMVSRGVTPSAYGYNSLINGLSRAGEWEEVTAVLEDMESRGVAWNATTFNCVLDARFKEGNFIDALQMVGDLDALGCARTLNVILNGLSSGFMASKADKVFEVMVERGLANTVSYTTMINRFCLEGEMTKAEEVFDRMVKNEVIPDTITFNTLANGYFKIGRFEEARRTLEDDLALRGLKPDIVTNNILSNIKMANKMNIMV